MKKHTRVSPLSDSLSHDSLSLDLMSRDSLSPIDGYAHEKRQRLIERRARQLERLIEKNPELKQAISAAQSK